MFSEDIVVKTVKKIDKKAPKTGAFCVLYSLCLILYNKIKIPSNLPTTRIGSYLGYIRLNGMRMA